MERLLKWTFYGCLALLPLSCWQRDDFVSDLGILPALAEPPAQNKTAEEPFDVFVNDVTYKIEPQYDYDLHGLVVSYQHHNGDRMVHRLWNDHLNVADICVVWGANANAFDLNSFEFWNGQFTCFFRTRDQQAWRRFDQTGLSNNHLITDDLYIRNLIDDVRVGDQIHIKGWLASYSHGDGYTRGTSISRTDEGNGACETIYVNSFNILSSMNNRWRILFDICLFAVIGLALLWVLMVMRGGFSHQTANRLT